MPPKRIRTAAQKAQQAASARERRARRRDDPVWKASEVERQSVSNTVIFVF